ncbi:MAG: hypothetical protein V1860_00705 [bacterium]
MKKTILSLFIIIFIALSAKFYFSKNSSEKIERLSIINPSSSAKTNGIIKLSAKFIGKPSNIGFAIKNSKDEIVKSGNGYYEYDSDEWVYYLNSLEIENGGYKMEARALSSNRNFLAVQDIKIDNAGYSPEKLATVAKTPAISEPNAPAAKNEEPKSLVKTEEPQKNEVQKENTPAVISAAPQENQGSKDEIINGVVKALSNLYDAINKNLLAEDEDDLAALPPKVEQQGKVAGTSVEKAPPETSEVVNEPEKNGDEEKKEEKPNDIDYGWFKYELKINDIENNELVKSEKMLNAKCNNPLDSLIFILDNLDTPEIDYTFNGENNYGYYTYWTYKLNPKNIKKGEYLLYAKGSIDWHSYESPMIVIRIE